MNVLKFLESRRDTRQIVKDLEVETGLPDIPYLTGFRRIASYKIADIDEENDARV